MKAIINATLVMTDHLIPRATVVIDNGRIADFGRKINTDFSKAAVTLIRGAVLHSDRGTQYTSALYRSTLRKNEELPDSIVVEVIVKLVSNPKFAAMMQEKISMKVDTSAIEQEIAAHEKQLRQSYSVKARLMEEIDSLDPDDKHYMKR